MGRPYFCWILSLYHSGMTLKLQKGMMRRSGVRWWMSQRWRRSSSFYARL